MSQPVNQEPQLTPETSQQKPFAEHPDWFNTFLDHFNGKRLGTKVTPEHLQEKFPALWSKITDPSQPVDILFIGAGNGIYEVPILHIPAENLMVCQSIAWTHLKNYMNNLYKMLNLKESQGP